MPTQPVPTTTSNGAVVHAHEATVQTAQVTINVIRVGTKQVTQAMFRQIPYKELIDWDTFTLRGTPWGVVRYWWEGCRDGMGDGRTGMHILWQDGETLHRAIVFETCETNEQRALTLKAQWAGNAAFILLDRSRMAVHMLGNHGAYGAAYRLGETTYRLALSSADLQTVFDYWRYKVDPAYKETVYEYARRGSEAAYAALVEQEGLANRTALECLAIRSAALAEFDAIAQAYAVLVAQLQALPQLFIAV